MLGRTFTRLPVLVTRSVQVLSGRSFQNSASRQIYTGKKPFSEVSNDMAVTLGVLEGNRPSNDPMIPEAIWKLFKDCWEQDAEKRPTAHQITKRLLSPSIGASQIQTPADWDETFSSRFRRSVLPGAFSLRPQHHALARKE
jgi:hypothetical protein